MKKVNKLITLEKSYYLIWATPHGEQKPFEVSKEIKGPLQPLCQTSPYCPGERIQRIRGEKVHDIHGTRIKSVIDYIPNPHFRRVKECPYRFRSKSECYNDINIKAMQAALFSRDEVDIYVNFLKAIGYRVTLEEIKQSEIDGSRILEGHRLFNYHEVQVEFAPSGVMLCLVRNPYKDEFLF